VWPNLGSVAVACTIGMIGRTWKAMSITKCVGAVMLTEKEGVLTQALVQEVSLEPGAAESTSQARGDLTRRGIYLSPPHQRAQFCAWPNLGSAALACTIGKSGRIRKPLITSTCVGAVVLKETRGALMEPRFRRHRATGQTRRLLTTAMYGSSSTPSIAASRSGRCSVISA
jgi:hypothetical protein